MEPLLLKTSCFSTYTDENKYIDKNSSISLLGSILKGCTHMNISIISSDMGTNRTYKNTDKNDDVGALLYIISVLVIYSVAIDVMIIKFLSKGKREIEEENKLEDFFRGMEMSRREITQDKVNRVAIQAFHTITSNVSNEDLTGDSDNYSMTNFLPTCASAPTIEEKMLERRLRYSLPCPSTARCGEISVM